MEPASAGVVSDGVLQGLSVATLFCVSTSVNNESLMYNLFSFFEEALQLLIIEVTNN